MVCLNILATSAISYCESKFTSVYGQTTLLLREVTEYYYSYNSVGWWSTTIADPNMS